MSDEIDDVLDKLAKDVELAVHAMYRGEARLTTMKVRTSHLVREAATALRARAADAPVLGAAAGVAGATGALSALTPATSPSAAGAVRGWRREDGEALMKCVTAWLPMGLPSSALPNSKCVSSGREMRPSWGERERARAALRKLIP